MLRQKFKEPLKHLYYILQGRQSDSFIFNKVIVLTTPYVLHIAVAIQDALVDFVDVTVESRFYQEKDDEIYIILCPQFFGRLPKKRIVYNFEQPACKKYFNSCHKAMFERSLGTIDYTYGVVREFIPKMKRYATVYPSSSVKDLPLLHWNPGYHKEYDLVFFGQINDRRMKIIEHLSKFFSILMVSDSLGSPLQQSLTRAKACLNLHLFDDSPFESTRFFQCLNLHLPMISEISSDQVKYSRYSDMLKFIDIGVPAGLESRISNALSALEQESIDFYSLRTDAYLEFASELLSALIFFGVDIKAGSFSRDDYLP